MYFATVDCETSIPSFSSSPWMRGAPQRLARLILRMRSLTSRETAGRPPSRLLFQLQYSRNPFRCQARTVSGLTMRSAERHSFHKRKSQTQKSRSAAFKRRRWRFERCRTSSVAYGKNLGLKCCSASTAVSQRQQHGMKDRDHGGEAYRPAPVSSTV